MATQLTEIKLDRVSMVDAGANQHADILLAKRKDDMKCMKEKPGCEGNCEECMTVKVRVSETLKAKESLKHTVEMVSLAVHQKYNPKTPDDMAGWINLLDVTDDSAIFEQKGQSYRVPYTMQSGSDGKMTCSLGEKVPVEVVYRDIKSAKAATRKGEFMAEDLATVQAELAKARADSDAAIAALTKRLDEQAAQSAKVEADLAKAKADAEKNATEAAEFKKKAIDAAEKQRLVECIAKGKSTYGAVNLEDEKKGALIKSIEDNLPEEDAKEVMKIFASHNAAVIALGKAPGVGGAASSDANGPYQKLQSLAKARASEKSIPFSKARAEVYVENPELYAEYMAERRKEAN